MPSWPWLLILGDASYSVYLAHLFAFDLIAKVWPHTSGPAAAAAFAVTAMLAAVGLALLTYRLIERPALAALARSRTVSAAPEGSSNQPMPAAETASVQ